VVFVVNPSNPPSYAIHPDTIRRLIRIVKEDNPRMMVISDDVYGTFVPGFRSLIGDSDERDHHIPAQADHPFRAKLTRAFRGKLTTTNV